MTINRLYNAWGSRGNSRIQRDPGPPISLGMARFRMQTRRDRVMSLLPPISLAHEEEAPLEERIFSDTPPPPTYSGSFPSKILRHVKKNTFYSPPTRGETAIISRTMYADPIRRRTTDNRGTGQPLEKSETFDKNITNPNHKANPMKPIVRLKPRGPKLQISSKSQVEFGSGDEVVKDSLRPCVSAPSSRGYSRDAELAEVEEQEPGNLTAPTTPRPVSKPKVEGGALVKAESEEVLNAYSPAMMKAESLEFLYTHAQALTPLEPRTVGAKEETTVHFELRGDAIEPLGSTSYDSFSRIPYTRPNSRSVTPLQRTHVTVPTLTEVPVANQAHIIKGFYYSTKERSGLRSAIRDVTRPLSRTSDTRKGEPNLLIRAVGYSLNDNPAKKAHSDGRRKSAVGRKREKEIEKQELQKENVSGDEAKLKETLTLAIMGPKENSDAVPANGVDGNNNEPNEKDLVKEKCGHAADENNNGHVTEKQCSETDNGPSNTEPLNAAGDITKDSQQNTLDNDLKPDSKSGEAKDAGINEKKDDDLLSAKGDGKRKDSKGKNVRFIAKGRRNSKAGRKKGRK